MKETLGSYRDMVDSVNSIILRWDADQHITFINKYALDFFGYTEEELLGKSLVGTIVPNTSTSGKDLAAMVKDMILHPDRYVMNENENIRKNGERVWVLWTNKAILDDEGHFIENLAVGNDITMRKLMEEKINRHYAVLDGINRIFHETITSETEEELGITCLKVAEELTRSKFGFIGEINSEGRLDDIAISNPGWEECRMANPIGHRIVPTGFMVHGIYGRVLKDGKPLYTNNPASHPDSIGTPKGHPPLKSFLGVPLIYAGKTIGMIGLGNREGGYGDEEVRMVESLAVAMVEAFNRKRTEQALKLDEARLEALFELNSMAGSTEAELFDYALDAALKITESRIGVIDTVSPDESAAYIHSVTKDVMEGCDIKGQPVLDVHTGGIWTYIFQTRVPLIVNNYPAPYPQKKGVPKGHMPLTKIIVVPMIENGRIVALCMMGNKKLDYTEADSRQLSLLMNGLWRIIARKRAEAEVMIAKQQAELYLDLLGHDISNIHQIMEGQLELAQEIMAEEGKLEGEEKELIDTPLETLVRSNKLIESVRKLQKLEAGEYHSEPVDIDGILSEVKATYSGVTGKDVAIDYAPVMGCYVDANPLLKDVFTNLVDNAVKHSNGPVHIGIKVDRVNEGRAYYRVAVEDNGPGIPDAKKDEIFHRFKRSQTKAPGTGLGLYIVKTLVASFHGKVWVEDRLPGDHTQGARFVVMLPAVEK